MILTVDVDYKENRGFISGITFNDWQQKKPSEIYTLEIDTVEEYEPGYFYKRELPCILQLLEAYHLMPEIIIVDGYVYLDGVTKPGLGKYLYDALNGEAAIIGVAKKAFVDISDDYSIYRGTSEKPLYITSAGLDSNTAKELILQMDGKHRIPTLLKKVDQVCRSIYSV